MTSWLHRWRNRQKIQRLFDDAAKRAAQTGGRLESEARLVSILIAELRGANELLEANDARASLERVNELLSAVQAPVLANSGVLLDLQEDRFRVAFGAPAQTDAHAAQAVRTAIAIRSAVAPVFEGWRAKGIAADGLAMGVSSGQAVAGLLGGGARMTYSVFGAPMRLAAALCAAARPGEILVSAATKEASADAGPWAPPDGRLRDDGRPLPSAFLR